MARKYVRVSLDAPGLGIVGAFRKLFDILNKLPPGLGWEFAVALGEREFIAYRDVESGEEFEAALEALRQAVGGVQHAQEVEPPLA